MIDVTCAHPASVVVASPLLKLATNSCTGFITAAVSIAADVVAVELMRSGPGRFLADFTSVW